MSGIGDAFAALKNVVLLHERMLVVQKDIEGLDNDLRDIKDYVVSIDKRVLVIETMIRMSERRDGTPRIGG